MLADVMKAERSAYSLKNDASIKLIIHPNKPRKPR
jgi:hypothetical protein